jgi:thiol-disulfide isomerase/thioredoxin
VPELRSAYRTVGIRLRTIISMLTCLVAVACVAGCTPGSASDRAPSGTGASNAAGFVAGDGTVQVIDVADRKAAPTLSGKTLTGSTFTLADHLGSVVVLNVWGSWCPPCRQEAPELQTAYTRLSTEAAGKVVFVGLNTRDNDPGPPIAFERNAKITYPSVYDPTGKQLLGFADSLPATAIPSTLVIDTKGRVAARILGATTTTTLVDVVKDVGDS